MADEIISTLGFEVADALQKLEQLDGALKGVQGTLGTLGTQFSTWNSQAVGTISTLNQIASAANKAAANLAKVNLPGGGGGAAAAPASAAPKLWLPSGYESSTQAAVVPPVTPNIDERPIKDADKATKGLTISWQTLARVVMTQAIVRAMSMVRDAIKEAVAASIEFQTRIAEIHTIAPELTGSFQDLSAEVANFAKDFNFPLPDTAEALYQTISNQFTTVSDRANVMNAAMMLAKVGCMDLNTAVSLLTGTLNAYGMGSNQAESEAAKFFTTIRLGRVRGKELADIFGQLAPIAAELGISTTELDAALVSLTIGGLDAHKSATALRGALSAMLKPSTDMAKAIRELGYANVEQMQSALGLQGSLEALANNANGLPDQIAKYFRNVRALTAELRLSQTGAEQVKAAMDALDKSSPEMLEKIFKEFRSTDAEKFTASVNKLKVELTETIGGTLVNQLGTLIETIGSDNIAAGIQAIAVAAVPAAIGVTALAMTFITLNAAMGPVGIAIMALTAASAAGLGEYSFATAKAVNESQSFAAALHAASRQRLADLDEEARKAAEAAAKIDEASNKAWEQSASAIRKTYFHELENLAEENKEIVNGLKHTTDSIIAMQERVVAAYRNAATTAVRETQQSVETRLALERRLGDQLFALGQKGRTTAEQAESYLAKSRSESGKAATMLAKARTQDERKSAEAAWDHANATQQTAENLAKSSKDSRLLEEAERTAVNQTKQHIESEKAFQRSAAEYAQDSATRAAGEQTRLNEMRGLQKKILDDAEAFNKKKQALSPQELARRESDLTGEIQDFLEKSRLGNLPVDILGADALTQKVQTILEGGASQVEIKNLAALPDTIQKLHDDIQKGLGPVQVMIEYVEKASPTMAKLMEGNTAEENMTLFSTTLKEMADEKANLRKMLDSRQRSMNTISDTEFVNERLWGNWKANNQDEMDVIDATKHLPQFTQAQRDAYQKNVAAFKDFQQFADKFTSANKNPVTQADFDGLQKSYAEYVKLFKPSADQKVILDEFVKNAKVIKETQDAKKAVEEGLPAQRTKTQSLMGDAAILKAALEESKDPSNYLKTNADAAKKAIDEFKTTSAQITPPDFTPLLMQIAAATQMIRSIGGMTPASAGSAYSGGGMVAADESDWGGTTAAFGGVVRKYFANGGPVGRDTIEARLAAGERVISARAAARFATQLTAMNAGSQPVFRHEGGVTTNIGDINVSVTGGSTGDQTGRAIAARIRRELRRGTSTLQ